MSNRDNVLDLIKNSSDLDQNDVDSLIALAEILDKAGYDDDDPFGVLKERETKKEPEKHKMSDDEAKQAVNEINNLMNKLGLSQEEFLNLLQESGGFIVNFPEEKQHEIKFKEKKAEVSDLEIATTNFEKLANLADKLDSIGAIKEANLVDDFIQKYSKSKEKSKPKDDEIKKSKTTVSLNTRYCPDHIGVTLGRISENTYQCPLDGQVYNWETGWTDYDGNKHPGGSVAEQTPQTSGYESPHRIFDSRESTLNRIN